MAIALCVVNNITEISINMMCLMNVYTDKSRQTMATKTEIGLVNVKGHLTR